MNNQKPVPVFMYHSVGIPDKDWQWYFLTCPYEIFEEHLKLLKKNNYHTVSLQQLFDYRVKGIKLAENPIALTFDDGYLDNWTFAFPLLKKYGFKGTIFVSPEFVDPTVHPRRNLEDVWKGNCELNQLSTKGFLSWKEMDQMEKSGVIDIQSHAMSHTFYEPRHVVSSTRMEEHLESPARIGIFICQCGDHIAGVVDTIAAGGKMKEVIRILNQTHPIRLKKL